eukprot:5742991-Amphidinium_carterae.1
MQRATKTSTHAHKAKSHGHESRTTTRSTDSDSGQASRQQCKGNEARATRQAQDTRTLVHKASTSPRPQRREPAHSSTLLYKTIKVACWTQGCWEETQPQRISAHAGSLKCAFSGSYAMSSPLCQWDI